MVFFPPQLFGKRNTRFGAFAGPNRVFLCLYRLRCGTTAGPCCAAEFCRKGEGKSAGGGNKKAPAPGRKYNRGEKGTRTGQRRKRPKKERSALTRPTLIAFGEPEGKKKTSGSQRTKGMTEEKRRTPALRMHGRSIGVSLWCEEESCAEGGCGFPPSVIVSIPPSCVEFMTQL